MARQLRPGYDPKKAQAKARRQGDEAAVLHAVTPAEAVARALVRDRPATAAQLRLPPPAGHAWHVVVSQGRTRLLGQSLEELRGGGEARRA